MFGCLNSRTVKVVGAAVLTASAALAIGVPSASADSKTIVLDNTVTLGNLQGICASNGGQYVHGTSTDGAWAACLLPGGQTVYCNESACVFVPATATSGVTSYKAPAPIGNRLVAVAAR